MATDRPHILMLVSDEHSPHYTSYEGHPHVRTPNLRRLHDQGVNCANGYCNSPICVPSRASQISGRFCRNCGVTDWFQDLHPGIATLPGHFAEHGYETVAFGKMHFYGDQLKGWQERPLGDFYDEKSSKPIWPERNLKHLSGKWERPFDGRGWFDVEASLAQAGPGNNPALNSDIGMFDAGIHRLRERFANGTPEKPLFLCISALIPHYPFICPPELFEYYRERVELPEIAEGDVENLHPAYKAKMQVQHPNPMPEDHQLNAIAAYCGMVEVLDQQIGRAMDALEELGVLDDFIVLHWSDHVGPHDPSERVAGGCFPDALRVM
jgi:choline-sulfatase